MKLRFSTQAANDLQDIGDYIAQSDPARALSFVRNLRTISREICEMPLAFPLVANFEHLGIRRRVVGTYLIFYRIDQTALTIIHILHGAHDYETWLDQL